MNRSFRDEICEKYPKLAERAKKGPKAAIRLFCIECLGGSKKEARECANASCFLHPHRGIGWAGFVPQPNKARPKSLPKL